MEVLNIIRLFWGWVFPYISRIHKACIGEYFHFRYLKCLVILFFPFLQLSPARRLWMNRLLAFQLSSRWHDVLTLHWKSSPHGKGDNPILLAIWHAHQSVTKNLGRGRIMRWFISNVIKITDNICFHITNSNVKPMISVVFSRKITRKSVTQATAIDLYSSISVRLIGISRIENRST